MNKGSRRVVIALSVLVVALGGLVHFNALGTGHPVGFRIVRVSPPEGPAFAVGLWYPTDARPRPTTLLGMVLMDVAPDARVAGSRLPLVVISHGNGGGPGSHADLALALADAGYVVAAPLHPGDNYADQSAFGSPAWLADRTRQVRATTDHVLQVWEGREHVDPGRVGAFGYSAGALTVLASAGARPDLGRIATHCAANPEFVCELLREANSPLLQLGGAAVAQPPAADPRIKAASLAAPGLAFTLDPRGLADVRVPVQLWSADDDANVPYATNTRHVRDGLGQDVEFHSVPGAAHFSFLVPCRLIGPPSLCADPPSFDREAFHAEMNARVVAFFDRTLAPPPG